MGDVARYNHLYEDEDFDDFEENDSFYYECEEMEQLMNEYVKKHAAEFVVNGEYDYFEM